ncbi:MAG: M56 family metallopeptidase [Planctomycetota bacterium]
MMTNIESFAIDLLWQSTMIGLVLWTLLRLVPLRRASLRRSLLVAGLIGFASLPATRLLPAEWRSPLFDVGELPWSASSPTTAEAPSQQPRITSAPIPEHSSAPAGRARTQTSGRRPTRAIEGELRLGSLLVGVWGLVATWLLARLARDAIRLHHWQAASYPASSFERRCAAEAARRVNCRKAFRLRRHPTAEQPLVCGTFRPLLLIPSDLSDRVSPQAFVELLVHEASHLERHDVALGWLQRLITAVLWPQPLVHWTNRQLALVREVVCDDDVVRSGGQPARFVRTLLSLSETRIPAVALASAAVSRRGDLERRVRLALDPNRSRVEPSWRARWLAVLPLVVATTLGSLWSCHTSGTSREDGASGGAKTRPGLDVLLVQGTPTWEYRYLVNTLLRMSAETNGSLQAWVESARVDVSQTHTGNRVALTALPTELDGYDVLVLGDIPIDRLEAALGGDDLDVLCSWIDQGGRLVLLPEEGKELSRFAGTPLERLPAESSEREIVELPGGRVAVRKAWSGLIIEVLTESTWRLRSEGEAPYERFWESVLTMAR